MLVLFSDISFIQMNMFLFDGAAASLRTADVSPGTSSAAMSKEKRLPFAGLPVPGVQIVTAVRSKKEREKIKAREGKRTSLPSPPLLFKAFFTSHRPPLSERLEQAIWKLGSSLM